MTTTTGAASSGVDKAREQHPVLASVEASPPEGCAGETVLVTVKTRAGADDAIVKIDGVEARVVAVELRRKGPQTVRVDAAAGGTHDEWTLSLGVNDCGTAFPRLRVSANVDETSDGSRYHLAADPYFAGCTMDSGRSSCVRPEPGETRTYTWTFGDGTTAERTEPDVDHVFPPPRTGEERSTFLVRVAVDSSVHGKLEGYRNVERTNTNESNKKHARTITPRTIPEKVERRPDGSVGLVLRVDNPESRPITLRDVAVRSFACNGTLLADKSDRAARTTKTLEVPPGRTLLAVDLPPPLPDPGACALVVDLTGAGADGMRASLFASISLEGPKTTKMDPAEMAEGSPEKRHYDRTLQALKLLGRDPTKGAVQVTDEEMRALERRGLLPPE